MRRNKGVRQVQGADEKGSFEKFGIVSDPGHVSAWQQEEEKFITPEQREAGYRLGCVAEIRTISLSSCPRSPGPVNR